MAGGHDGEDVVLRWKLEKLLILAIIAVDCENQIEVAEIRLICVCVICLKNKRKAIICTKL